MASQESSYAMPPLTQSIKNVLNFGYDESGDIKPTNQTLNVEALFMVVSNIMEASFKVSDPNIKLNVNKEDKATLSGFKSPIERLQKIACQMRRIVPDAAQETTVKMMTDLRKEYPWHVIAVMALAGFALDYGNFHLLSQVKDGEHLGTSLAVLNDVQAVVEGSVKETVSKYNCLVRDVFLTVQCLLKLKGMLEQQDYAELEDLIPTLDEARLEFPYFVYLAVYAIVVCSSTFCMGSYQVSNDTLSKTSKWISDVLATLQGYLKEIEEKKGEIDEYSERLRGAFQTPTGILQVLKCLLFPKSPEHHYVYYRSTKSRVKIDEMCKNKCVLLFISGLFGIEDEIKLLKEISEDLASNPKCEKDGMRKGDFKILWVPIVSSSLDSEKIKTQFNFIAQQFVTWSCVVDYSIVGPACKKLIRQKLRYMNKPMIAVFNQRGSRTNNDALAMLFAWGHHAFPWSTGDDLIFVRNWNWFWSILKDINQQLTSLNEKDYNIIFGCVDEADTNNYDGSWLGKITVELEKIKRDKIISSSGFAIKYYHHGKQAENDFKFAYKFWAFVENVFTSLKSMKTTTIKDDPSLDNLKKFLALRREKSGWVIISQGSEVKMVGSGVSVYKTLYKFESWKHNITQHGFDGAFVNEHFNEFPPQSNCLRLDLKTNVSDVSVPLECVTCQSEMEIQLVRYVCCHGNHSHAKYVHRLA